MSISLPVYMLLNDHGCVSMILDSIHDSLAIKHSLRVNWINGWTDDWMF